ncbi:hypothetical protein MRX96_048813 [Rhipicephalus microplus]
MMWHAMKEDMVSSVTEGVERVERGGYAFLMESTSIEYVVRRRCQLKQIGGLLDSKGYGIATPHGSPYRDILSSTLLHLQERGTLRKFKDHWWKVRDPLKRCPTTEAGESRTDATSTLGLRTVGGVFVVLLAGLGLACLIAFAELFYSKGYGIATPHGSPYQNILSSTLLRLQEHGTLRKFKDRWWEVRDPLKECPTTEAGESRTDAASELGL